MKNLLRKMLKKAGKGDRQVAAVFGWDDDTCRRCVFHLRHGIPDVPVWLFSPAPPPADVAALCERVHVRSNTAALFAVAQRTLWSRRLVLAVAPWNGRRGRRLLKLAPLLVPPCRALFVNPQGDFLPGTPTAMLAHWRWRLHEISSWLRDRGRDSARLLSLLLLAAFSRMLELCGRPHRRIFHRVRRLPQAPLRHRTRDANGSIAEYPQKGEAWDGAAFEAFLRSAGDQFVLWRCQPSRGFDAASQLWSDPHTFALSRQTHFRAWKPLLIPTAPFRALQPGAASRVLAPISDAILADREKLLALGIPRCRYATTAWMLLFWRAAAAGWISYSIGRPESLREQPDFPVQETAFVFEVLRDRRQRALAPAGPDLARGNIAFLPAPPPPSTGRLKVLVVSPFLPYPFTHGGAVRIYSLCQALRGRVDFTLVSVREQHDVVNYDRLKEVFREVYVVDVDDAAAAAGTLPERVRHLESPSLRALIVDLCRRWQPDLVQFEYTQTAALRTSAADVPAILVEHDLTFELYRQVAESGSTPAREREYAQWLEFERRWLRRFDGVWTMSPEDRARAIEEGASRNAVFAIPNGVDLHRFRPGGAEAPFEILYVGSFRHHPNVLGFEMLRREILPRVWNRFPQARLRVVAGPRPELYCPLAQLDSRIELHAFVEHLVPLYARAAVVVAPLQVSAGTNIKVLEALACGKAIVSTPLGCAGLGLEDGRDLVIREDRAAFAASICDFLADPALRAAFGRAARHTAQSRFGWDQIAERAYESYQTLASPVLSAKPAPVAR